MSEKTYVPPMVVSAKDTDSEEVARRLSAQRTIYSELEGKRVAWPFRDGDYASPLPSYNRDKRRGCSIVTIAGKTESYTGRESETELIGIERTFNYVVRQALVGSSPDDPAVFVDNGGYLGFTWRRLAFHNKEAVLGKTAVFVITTLGRYPITIEDLEVPGSLSPTSEDVKELFRQSTDLVETVSIKPSDIGGDVATFANREVSLRTIDLLHERYSTAEHSDTADIELQFLATRLSPRGIYILEGFDYLKAVANRNDLYWFKRHQRVLFAIERLLETGGFELVTTLDEGGKKRVSVDNNITVIRRIGGYKLAL